MCTHSRFIYNPYSRKKVLVSCGMCEACQQEKALLRANRIRNNVSTGTLALFITLTYAPDFVPYLLRSDLLNPKLLDVNIYRDAQVRRVYSRFTGFSWRKYVGTDIIDSRYIDINYRFSSEVRKLKSLNGHNSDCIGVCYYPDLKNFFKRLRQILKRNFNYEKNFSYYACSEYGGHSQRPHFHALLFIPTDDEALFRSAILASWPYADNARTEKYIEVAKDAASYVASYVNGSHNLQSVLSSDDYKQKHSYSQGFGVALSAFSLSKILQKINTGDLYYYRKQKFAGEDTVIPVPIPQYVLNRYFPKFKGFGRLTAPQLRCLLLAPERASELLSDSQYDVTYSIDSKTYKIPISCRNVIDYNYHFTAKETYQIYVRLDNCYQNFHRVSGMNRFDFADYYVKAWDLHSLISQKLSLTGIDTFSDFEDYYENLAAYEEDLNIVAPTLSGLSDLCYDPNQRSDIIRKSVAFTDIYYKTTKQKNVTNFCMVSNGHYV